MKTRLVVVATAVLLSALALSPTAHAGNGNSDVARACAHDGWRDLRTTTGLFANEGDCVKAGSHGEPVFPIPHPHVELVQYPTWFEPTYGVVGSGFQPNSWVVASDTYWAWIYTYRTEGTWQQGGVWLYTDSNGAFSTVYPGRFPSEIYPWGLTFTLRPDIYIWHARFVFSDSASTVELDTDPLVYNNGVPPPIDPGPLPTLVLPDFPTYPPPPN